MKWIIIVKQVIDKLNLSFPVHICQVFIIPAKSYCFKNIMIRIDPKARLSI
jgi:hypothetical protein